MKKFYHSARGRISGSFRWLIVTAFLLASTASYATHLAGGELTYRCLNGGTLYEFTATFYRDCSGFNAPPSLVLEYKSDLCGVGLTQSVMLNVSHEDITLTCPSAFTTCNGGSTPGFQRWVYKDTIDLGLQCSDWVFDFNFCCRNNAINTIDQPGTDNMYIESTLDNSLFLGISSPVFDSTSKPVLSFCLGQSFSYSQHAHDIDGDDLVYSFIAPRVNSTDSVDYLNPYSSTNPINSPITVDASGLISVTPTSTVFGVATLLVQKYHNGNLVGSILRDMEMIVTNCTNNLPTATGIDGVTYEFTPSLNFTNTDTVCAGSNTIFTILSDDQDLTQLVTMTQSGVDSFPGATFNIAGQFPIGTFDWTPTMAEAGKLWIFSVTVKDDNCPQIGQQTYTYNIWVPAIDVAIIPDNVLCFGGTGGATAVGSGGVSPYTYSWSSGSVTDTALGLLANVAYTVTATDNFGCANSNTVTLTEPDEIIALVVDSVNASCNTAADGSATVSASGGTGVFTHHWSDGQTDSVAIGLAAGTYTDTVMDGNGCTKLVTVTITEPDLLIVTITSHQDATCHGQTNGSLTATASGGTEPYFYVWLPGFQIDSAITGLSAGTDTVIVIDNHGCFAFAIDSITQPDSIVALITAVQFGTFQIRCHGDSTGAIKVDTILGGTGPFTHSWSTGSTADSIFNLVAGTYSDTIRDANGCDTIATVTLNEPDTITVLINRDFDLSVFAGNNMINISCYNQTDGQIKDSYFISGGYLGTSPDYTYLWMPGNVTTKGDSGLAAGTYTVTVTDSNGCFVSDTVTLYQPDSLYAIIASHANVGCHGESNGALTDTVFGGTPPYAHSWSNGFTGGNLSSTIDNLIAGTYTDTIRDANGCMFIVSDSIQQPDTIVPHITAAQVTGGNNIACFGDLSGTVRVDSVSGGTPSFTYSWTYNGTATSTLDSIFGVGGADSVHLHISDAQGCSHDTVFKLSEPEPLSVGFLLSSFPGSANVSCFGASDGFIQLTAGGGNPGYSYTWTPNVSTDSIATGLSANIQYSVVVLDTNGCKDSLSFMLTQPDLLTIDSFLVQNISCNGGSNGVINGVNISGGTQGVNGYDLFWTPAVTIGDPSLIAGTYYLTVTDTNLCSANDSVTLTEPDVLLDTLTAFVYLGGKNIRCFGDQSSGHINDSVSGGTAPYSFVWNTGNPKDTLQNLDFVGAGTYTVTITDAQGCVRIDTITLTEPDSINPNPVISIHGTYNIGCNGDTGCIVLTPSGGTPGYAYLWNPAQPHDTLNTFCGIAGTYSVTITDTLGCESKASYTLTQPNSLVIDSVNVSDFNGVGVRCSDDTTTSFIHVVVSGGVLPYTYSWTKDGFAFGGNTPNLDSLGAGTYVLALTDSLGCTNGTTVILTVPDPLIDSLVALDYGGYNVTCQGQDGMLTFNLHGGTVPYQITVTGGLGPYVLPWTTDTVQTLDSLIAGFYTVTVTDTNGCNHVDTITLVPFVNFVIDTVISDYFGYGIHCYGDSSGSIMVKVVSGGTAPYTHSWSTGFVEVGDSSTLSNLPAGTYTDSISDVNGCKIFVSRTLTQPALDTTSFTATACDSFPLPWGGTVTSSADSSHTYTNIFGCDSIVTAHITINYSTSSTTPFTACDSYVWNGSTFTTSGSYSYDVGGTSNSVGCDSVANLNLVINYSTSSTTPFTACDSYVWNGSTFTTSGSYSYDVGGSSNAAGCDSVANLNLVINYSTSSTTPFTACDSYVWNGSTFTTSGSYSYDVGGSSNSVGCDSVANLDLVINYSTSSTTPFTACDSYVWNGSTFTTSGSYSYDVGSGSNSVGCDSVANLNLVINYSTSSTTPFTACDSYVWNGSTFTTSGSYSYDVGSSSNAVGCDSVANLNLVINYRTSSTTPFTACDSYVWNGSTFTTSGSYSYDVGGSSNSVGCDSVANLNLVINYRTSSTTPFTACDSYVWNGSTFTTSGSYSYDVGSSSNSVGCDSVANLNLVINYSTHTPTTPSAQCDSYVWNGATYTTSGTYTFGYNNGSGCASVDTLHLTINNSTHNSTTPSAQCDSYVWNGATYTASGTYTFGYNNGSGCASVDTLHLTINNSTHNSTTPSAQCDSYVWSGTTYTASGTYTFGYTNGAGCASVDTLHLTINNSTHTSTTPSAQCDSYVWNGTTYTASGTYTFGYTNGAGCASVDTLHLTINNSTHTSTTPSAQCDSYVWNGTTYTASGTYTFGYTNGAGCASVDTLHLTINNSTHNSTTITQCDSYVWNGTTYTSSATFTFGYTNGAGCPSVDTLHLTINNSTHNSSTPAAQCDSYVWNGTTYTASGTYTFGYSNGSGCASVDTLHLTISNATHNSSTVTECDSYTWNSTNYTTGGTYTFSYTNGAGCPSVDTLHLTINYSTHNVTSITQCDTAVWNGTTYNSSGDYTFSYNNPLNNCPSVDTLHLTILESSAASGFNVDACDTYQLPWGATATTSGDYENVYTNAVGCDSIVTYHVTIFTSVRSDAGLDVAVCPDSVSTITLSANTPQPGSGFWTSLDGAKVDNPSSPTTGVTGLVKGANRFVWTVTNGPCATPDTVVITVREDLDCFVELAMPTGFTPNGDTYNDYFIIHGIERYPDNKFVVFNRWGNQVYSVDDYDNTGGSRTWQGQNQSGDPLPDGTYFAILVVQNGSDTIKLHGYVDIRR